jgi:hypothetical protein
MSLKDWQSNGWLKLHKTTRRQVFDLFAIVQRDTEAAKTEDLTPDWKFGIAYNAALKLCTILLYAEGYRPENSLAHYRTLQALSEVLGDSYKRDVDYLEACRVKRNKVEYDSIDQATPEQATELVAYVEELKGKVERWLNEKHPDLMP